MLSLIFGASELPEPKLSLVGLLPRRQKRRFIVHWTSFEKSITVNVSLLERWSEESLKAQAVFVATLRVLNTRPDLELGPGWDCDLWYPTDGSGRYSFERIWKNVEECGGIQYFGNYADGLIY